MARFEPTRLPDPEIMSTRQSLPPVLRGEEASELSPADRDHLEALAEAAQAEGLLVLVRDECAARLRQPHPSLGVEYLLAAAAARNGEIERSHQVLLALGEKLVAARAWEPLTAVAERALALQETHAGAHLLVRAHEGLGAEPARLAALRRAFEILPEDLELGLLLALRLGEAGRGAERRALLAELTPRFAAERRWVGLEEAALEFVEHREIEGLLRLLAVLPDVAAAGAVTEAAELTEIAFPPLASTGAAAAAYATLRRTAEAAVQQGGPAAAEPFRAPLLEALRQGPARELPHAETVLAMAGLEDRLKPLPLALTRYDAVAALPPGRAVLHASFGAGRVIANDTEMVVIDFARSPGHRMPYAAARRSLTPLAEDDLRLLAVTDAAALERMRREEPGEFLVRTLHSMGGESDTAGLKTFLVGHRLVAAGEWTALLRKLKAAAEKDPRIDHARAFEQHYRLAPDAGEAGAAAADVPLPPLEPRKPVRANLATMRKFLTQHPGEEAALARRFGRWLERALRDREGDRVDRARAGLFFARWFPERVAEWAEVLRDLWEQGLMVSDLSSEDEQLALLAASHAAGVEGDAILSALDSRFPAVREAAARLRQELGAEGQTVLRRTLIVHAPRYPAAAARQIESDLAGTTPPADPWRLLWAALALIEERPKPAMAEKVLGWIAAGGPFDRLLAGSVCPEDVALRITVLLRQWRSSDRFLFPALEAAERVGLAETVEAVHSTRRRSTERMFDQVGRQTEADLPVMTRSTWKLLRAELDRLERELRTTIPATIQKARELGDLRENAEYHSAKLKQANVSKQVAALQQRLARARFVEDAAIEDGVVGLGTEVVLESDRELTTWWILGEGEHHHGAHVISFQTPVGRSLMGKGIGDEVELGEGDERRRYRVISIERKLPPSEASEPSR
jgi:transcription elongation factor GreA